MGVWDADVLVGTASEILNPQLVRSGDFVRPSANPFERNAGLARGGYREAPVSNAGFRALARAAAQTLTLKPRRLAERSR